MSTHSQIARELFDSYDKFMNAQITSRRFTQADMLRWLKPLEQREVFEKSAVGTSAEGRTIYLLKFGKGSVKVFLWSQMHGDEATATMALLDMFNFFAENPSHPIARSIREHLTLLVVPMVNPDGAERFQRRTAQLIDMNRDALKLETPEAKILRALQQKYIPEFGFNLHDQDPRYTVGTSNKVTAIALLAPATDPSRSDNSVRLRAKKVAARLAGVLNEFIPGHVAKYDDTFEPRAFGDNIQRWGTSTVLIESGGWPRDRQKMFLRKLNCVALLAILSGIADQSFEGSDVSVYEQLPFNTKNLYDIILRNARLQSNDRVPPVLVDVGFNLEERADTSEQKIRLLAKTVDIGDLSTFAAFEEIDAAGAFIDASKIQLDTTVPYEDVRTLFQRK